MQCQCFGAAWEMPVATRLASERECAACHAHLRVRLLTGHADVPCAFLKASSEAGEGFPCA
jgi:hypothetical protein